MFGIDFKFEDRTKELEKAAHKASASVLGKSAGRIRKAEIKSFHRSPGPSAPGTAPNTRKGLAKRAVRFDVDRTNLEAVIGPQASVVGAAMAIHEFGEEFEGHQFPERPFARPALEENASLFAEDFSGSIGE